LHNEAECESFRPFVDFFSDPDLCARVSRADDPSHHSLSKKSTFWNNGLMAKDINHPNRFIPYIQKFEFEALLFSNNQGFSAIYGSINPQIAQATQAIIDQYDNPEEINNHPNTAPSKRIQKIFGGTGYDLQQGV
jgi:hypothetical protein